ncbi:MAG: hypothetical protein WB630_04665 [Candidatus Acidiferrales bacterium]
MLGPFDYGVWLIGFLLEIYVIVCAISRRDFLRYLGINVYMGAAALVTLGEFLSVRHYGFQSIGYRYIYYYSESSLTILLFWVIIQCYQQVFAEMEVSRYIRRAAAFLLIATCFFSYVVIHENKDHLTSRFVVELGQNLYFVGLVLTYLLWGAVLTLRETRARLIQVVLALGVYFSASAGIYALRNLFPVLQPSILRWLPPLMGVWLPLAWSYTFTKVPDDARLMPARLMVKAR